MKHSKLKPNNMDHHIASSEKEIKKYASEYIAREASRMSLITITRSETSSDGKRAVLFVSVLPEKALTIAMNFLKRHQDDIRQHILKRSKVARLPWLRFAVDSGEQNRQLVDQLLRDETN